MPDFSGNYILTKTIKPFILAVCHYNINNSSTDNREKQEQNLCITVSDAETQHRSNCKGSRIRNPVNRADFLLESQ
ncbi:hypothetical protein P7K49_027147 [Saguinus oedipus]|uniref:Uncharacterized protein n=1 Tax=Saguinus oedipus TaxID=9490 RepID=A0ABQ9UFE6_SAGOE|nr:hypothetical protein P7K49_027147 [Saguinus oedipus]